MGEGEEAQRSADDAQRGRILILKKIWFQRERQYFNLEYCRSLYDYFEILFFIVEKKYISRI